METKMKTVDPLQIDEKVIAEAASLIKAGELVAFPTETVYGLGADAFWAEAAVKIYAAKGRPSDNPLIVHIAEFEGLERAAREVTPQVRKLAETFWPGPLTLIVHKNENVPEATTGGLDTVALRMPDHPVALELIRRSGCLIAAPSANTSGRPSPTLAAHVWDDLAGKIAMIVDGGPVSIGIESTILDMTEERPVILRPGRITGDMISEVLGEAVELDSGILLRNDGRSPKAPGMKYRHYAPKAKLTVVGGTKEAVAEKINELVQRKQNVGEKVAVIASEETVECYDAAAVMCIGSIEDEDTIAQRLYRILRECDEMNVSAIYSESFETPRLGQAIMNRLLKAAGHTLIHVS